jgi:hypothetical protein
VAGILENEAEDIGHDAEIHSLVLPGIAIVYSSLLP